MMDVGELVRNQAKNCNQNRCEAKVKDASERVVRADLELLPDDHVFVECFLLLRNLQSYSRTPIAPEICNALLGKCSLLQRSVLIRGQVMVVY